VLEAECTAFFIAEKKQLATESTEKLRVEKKRRNDSVAAEAQRSQRK